MSATERVGIIVEVQGGTEALNLMKNLESVIKRLNGTKLNIDLGSGKLKGIVSATNQAEKLGSTITKTSTRAKSLGSVMKTTFNSTASMMQHAGQSAASLGKTLERLSSPMRTLFRSTVWAAGFKALDLMNAGFARATQRADILATYQPVFKAMGAGLDVKGGKWQSQLETAYNRVYDSVVGLPTGIDQIVNEWKLLTIATQDYDKAANLAIASNNAILASGADEAAQNIARRELRTLMTTGKLTEKQWDSLRKGIPVAWNAIEQDLKKSGKIEASLLEALKSKEITAQDFGDLLIKEGISGKTKEVVNEMLHTYNAATANIVNAFSNMGKNLLTTLDEVLLEKTGKDTIDYLIGMKDVIGSFSQGLQDWIRANPDKFLEFFDAIKSFDWAGLAHGVGDGLLELMDMFKSFIGFFKGEDVGVVGNTLRNLIQALSFGKLKNIEDFGKFMAKMPLYAKGFIVLGSFLKGTKFLPALFTALAKGLGHAAKGNMGKIGLFGMIGKLLGKTKDIKELEKIEDAVSGTGALGKASGGLVKIAKNAGLAAATLAGISFGGFVVFRSFKTMIKDLREIVSELSTMTGAEWEMAAGVLGGMSLFFAAFIGISQQVGTAMGVVTSLSDFFALPAIKGGLLLGGIATFAAGVLKLDMAMVADAFASFRDITQSLKTGLENIKGLEGIKFKKEVIDDALQMFRDIHKSLTDNYDEGGSAKEGGGSTKMLTDTSKYKTITENIKAAVKGVKDTLKELETVPQPTKADLNKSTEKVKQTIGKMKEIYAELLKELQDPDGDGTTNGSQQYRQIKNLGIVDKVAGVIETIKNSLDDLKELESIDVKLDEAKGNAISVGTKMGEIFTALNKAFGEETRTTTNIDSVSSITENENKGITQGQLDKATNLKTLFDAYKQTITSIREIYESLMGGEGDMAFNVDDFTKVMDNITGEKGILAQLKGMYDDLISEESGFGNESEVDLAGIMEGFANAVGSVKDAVTTLSEIGKIEFEGDGGMSGIVSQIKQMVTDLTTAFSEESIGTLTEQMNAFKTSIEQLKLAIESIGSVGGEGDGGINVNITIIPEITGDEETVQKLQEAHDAIKKKRDAVEALSGAIHLSIPISVSLPGLEGAIQSMYNAASRLRAARSALNSARGGGGGWSTGGLISPRGAIYRAKGGDAAFPGRPRGTDTIPAWLTPGEYVHRKRAVDFFGIDFMRKINNLDVRGAMNDLMARAGNMARANRQTIINNTYNNNQKVVQNIKTNSSDFAYRSASRFVGAF